MKLLALSLAVFLAAGGGWATSNATQRGPGNESYTMQEERRTQMTAPVIFLPNWATEVVPDESVAIAAGGDTITLGDDGVPHTSFAVTPPTAAVVPDQLTEAEVRATLVAAGWPLELHEEALAVSWCESRWSAATGDHGSSLGLFQLWTGWFQDGEDPMDYLTNARVALRVRMVRGRWGGGGGWTCADLLGIP